MNKMKSQNLFVALSLVWLASACGKSMNLQVNDPKAGTSKQTSETVDANKSKAAVAASCPGTSDPKAQCPTEKLEKFSTYDLNELKDKISEDSLAQRATLQIAPKEAIDSVSNLELVLKKAVIADPEKVSICIVETECRPLSAYIKDPKAEEIHINLLDVFKVSDKTCPEITDWVYANSTSFADPGYRKFRFTFEGITSIEDGSLFIQYTVNDKLPKDFATAPTCYEHGTEDLNVDANSTAAPAAKTTDSASNPDEVTAENAAEVSDAIAEAAAAATAAAATGNPSVAAAAAASQGAAAVSSDNSTDVNTAEVKACGKNLYLTQMGCMPKSTCKDGQAMFNNACIPVLK